MTYDPSFNPAFRDRTKIDGFTEEELKVALLLYCHKVKMDIFEEVRKEGGIDLLDTEDTSILEVFHTLMDKAITQGMEMAADRNVIKQYYEHVTGNKVLIDIHQYEFEEHKGISGILLPDATFIQCGNGQHSIVVEQMGIPMPLQFQCLYFSSQLRFALDGVVSNSPVGFKGTTLAQVIWCQENIRYMDEGQKQMYHIKYTEEVKG